MRIKICGITNVDDALAAVQAGADAIGLNFVSGPRKIDTAVASEILRRLPPLVTPVALVRCSSSELTSEFRHWLQNSPITHLQIYPAAGESFTLDGARFALMPVIAVKDEKFAEDAFRSIPYKPAAVILDTYDPNRAGGTGTTFPWEWVSAARRPEWPPIILAGGLRPDNVADAVRIVQPYAVDVSSGVEIDGSPGKKDIRKMREFVRNAKYAI